MDTPNEEISDDGGSVRAPRPLRLALRLALMLVAMIMGLGGTYLFVGDRRDDAWRNVDELMRNVSRAVRAPWYEPPPPRKPSIIELLAQELINGGPEALERAAALREERRAAAKLADAFDEVEPQPDDPELTDEERKKLEEELKLKSESVPSPSLLE